MFFKIDLDRGVHSRTHPATGMDVYMYVDDPGVYLTAHGTPVPEELAVQAGFPTQEYAKKRRIKLALAAAHNKVMQELAEANQGEKIVTKERDGFRVVDLGYDRYQVLSPDGDVLNTTYLSLNHALILLDQLVPPEEEATEPQTETEPSPVPSQEVEGGAPADK